MQPAERQVQQCIWKIIGQTQTVSKYLKAQHDAYIFVNSEKSTMTIKLEDTVIPVVDKLILWGYIRQEINIHLSHKILCVVTPTACEGLTSKCSLNYTDSWSSQN